MTYLSFPGQQWFSIFQGKDTKLALSVDIHVLIAFELYFHTDDLDQDVLLNGFHWSKELLCNFLILILDICYIYYCIRTNYWNILYCTPKRTIHLLWHFLQKLYSIQRYILKAFQLHTWTGMRVAIVVHLSSPKRECLDVISSIFKFSALRIWTSSTTGNNEQ